MMTVAMATVYREEEVQSGHNETMKVFTEVYLPSIKKLKKLWHSCIDPSVRAVRFWFSDSQTKAESPAF